MSFKKEWLGLSRKVITLRGPGEIISIEEFDGFEMTCKVKLETSGLFKEFAIEQVVLDSDYVVVRVLNLSKGIIPEMQLFANAKSYPTWEEAREALKLYAANETLIALNFEKKRFESNRILRGGIAPPFPGDPNYHLVQVYFGDYWPMKGNFFETEEEAKKAWAMVEKYSETADKIWLNALINLEENEILARAIFSPMGVIKKETWW